MQSSSSPPEHALVMDEPQQDITRLLRLAASSISLLTLPQTDEPGSKLPQGEERPEQFVVEVGEYFERLDVCNIPSPRGCLMYADSIFRSRFKLPCGQLFLISAVREFHLQLSTPRRPTSFPLPSG